MQVAGMLQSQWDMQHMQQEGVQQLLAKEGVDQERSYLPRLLNTLASKN